MNFVRQGQFQEEEREPRLLKRIFSFRKKISKKILKVYCKSQSNFRTTATVAEKGLWLMVERSNSSGGGGGWGRYFFSKKGGLTEKIRFSYQNQFSFLVFHVKTSLGEKECICCKILKRSFVNPCKFLHYSCNVPARPCKEIERKF